MSEISAVVTFIDKLASRYIPCWLYLTYTITYVPLRQFWL